MDILRSRKEVVVVFFGFLHTSKAYLPQSGLGIGLVWFDLGLRTPKRFRLNRFGLDKAKPIKPKLNYFQFLHVHILKGTFCRTWHYKSLYISKFFIDDDALRHIPNAISHIGIKILMRLLFT